jgi:hypothetical protein
MNTIRPRLAAAVAALVVLALAGCTYETRDAAPVAAVEVLSDADQDAAQIAAMTALNTYAAPAESNDAWHKNLAPLVTADYSQTTADVQPPRLKTATITATTPEAPPTGDGDQVRVKIGTDTGSWFVVVVRENPAAPWLASSITPAQTT